MNREGVKAWLHAMKKMHRLIDIQHHRARMLSHHFHAVTRCLAPLAGFPAAHVVVAQLTVAQDYRLLLDLGYLAAVDPFRARVWLLDTLGSIRLQDVPTHSQIDRAHVALRTLVVTRMQRTYPRCHFVCASPDDVRVVALQSFAIPQTIGH